MNPNNFTIKSQEVMQRMQQLALQYNNQAMEMSHLMKAILEVDEQVTPYVFKKMGVNVNVVRQAIDKMVEGLPNVTGGQSYLARPTAEAIQRANNYLTAFGDEYVAIEHLLLRSFGSQRQRISTAKGQRSH